MPTEKLTRTDKKRQRGDRAATERRWPKIRCANKVIGHRLTEVRFAYTEGQIESKQRVCIDADDNIKEATSFCHCGTESAEKCLPRSYFPRCPRNKRDLNPCDPSNSTLLDQRGIELRCDNDQDCIDQYQNDDIERDPIRAVPALNHECS